MTRYIRAAYNEGDPIQYFAFPPNKNIEIALKVAEDDEYFLAEEISEEEIPHDYRNYHDTR